ncbi:protein of unknown function [Pedobacter steynii]|uniref:DUF4397 domain-containing protein n=1 Tax=Pedobacter steynii TaxID=430522 RepID=A0A1H0EBQ1_9SPHI|nr:DUF4397 domain-containing protein [Pedobacter steynii]NQX41974.1 DUF4397 domain-containing protein [Pedobacter steynii]SDN79775.1 protein of unknown function [Pedobacter steynii]
MEISNNLKNISKAFIAAVTISVALSACSKRNDPQSVPATVVSVVNASPNVKELDFIIGGQRWNTDPFKFGTTLDYVGFYPGAFRIGIVERGKNTYLLSKDLVYQASKYYSTFLIDTGTNRSFLTVIDNLDSPATSTKARVRFLNLSPDASPLILAVKGGTTDLFTNKAYKAVSAFTEVEAGDNVAFEIKDNATKAVLTTVPGTKLEQGKYYTIYAKGYKDKSDTDPLKFGANIYIAKNK